MARYTEAASRYGCPLCRRMPVSTMHQATFSGLPSPLPSCHHAQDAMLQDGAGHKPAYNLRTLCRALEYAAQATPTYGLQVRAGAGAWDRKLASTAAASLDTWHRTLSLLGIGW